MPHTLLFHSAAKRFGPLFGVLIISQAVSGCVVNSKSNNKTSPGDASFVTGSLNSNSSLLQRSDKWAAKWQKNPSDAGVAINYARSLRAVGSYKKAVQVLQQASLKSPKNQAVIAEYGKALSTIGQFKQAMFNLNRAQSLGTPDWRIYSAQGITLDRMEQHSKARKYYKTALGLKPDQPSVLNNIGLSYALEGDLANAETYLRRAAAINGSQPKVKKNLALVLGLNGKFSQSAKTSNEVLSSQDTTVNIAYLKKMLSQPGTWQKLSGKSRIARSKLRKTKRQAAASPRKITTLETTKATS
ncbi:MAG TPA: tetratricopeptide repeat protein, partial [Rhizobiales bacterium]|nr:tetratricopeptide repeat protein [Hyphomicrobiales bacterium]